MSHQVYYISLSGTLTEQKCSNIEETEISVKSYIKIIQMFRKGKQKVHMFIIVHDCYTLSE